MTKNCIFFWVKKNCIQPIQSETVRKWTHRIFPFDRQEIKKDDVELREYGFLKNGSQ